MRGLPRPPAGAAAGAAAAALALLAAAPASAYLSDTAPPVANALSVKGNEVSVVEDFDPVPDDDGWVRKRVSVRNTGDTPCFVRALVGAGSLGESMAISWCDAGWSAPDADGYRTHGAPLAPGEESAPLMEGLRLDDGVSGDVDVYVYVESVQSDGFKDAAEAFGSLSGKGET